MNVIEKISEIMLTDTREAIDHPGLYSGHVAFTDGKCLLLINEALLPGHQIKEGGFERLFNNLNISFSSSPLSNERLETVNRSLIMDKFTDDMLKYRPKKIECEECNGDGGDECCECNSMIDCKACKGRGYHEIAERESFKEPAYSSNYICVNGVMYDCTLFYKVFKSIDLVKDGDYALSIFGGKNSLRIIGEGFFAMIISCSRGGKSCSDKILLRIGD